MHALEYATRMLAKFEAPVTLPVRVAAFSRHKTGLDRKVDLRSLKTQPSQSRLLHVKAGSKTKKRSRADDVRRSRWFWQHLGSG
jgi:hypothetical protein